MLPMIKGQFPGEAEHWEKLEDLLCFIFKNTNESRKGLKIRIIRVGHFCVIRKMIVQNVLLALNRLS